MLDLIDYPDFAADFFVRFWLSAHPRSSGMFVLKKETKTTQSKNLFFAS